MVDEQFSKTRIYVANLSYSTNDRDLMDLFKDYGSVKEARVMTDRETGKSRGFAFVEMSTAEDAERTLGLDGKEFMDRKLKVSFAKAKTNR